MFRILKVRDFAPYSVRGLSVICLIVIFVIGQVGCAARTPPPRLTLEMRAKLGTIGVVPARFIPEADFQLPAKGWLGGAGRGAAVGALGGMGAGSSLSPGGDAGLAGAAIIALALALVATGTVVGGVYGAVAAESKATVEDAEAALKRALAAMNIQQALVENFVAYAQTETCYAFELLVDRGPGKVNEKVDYTPLARSGVDTILEVNVLKFGFEGEWSINPPVHVSMAVQTRVIRAGDNTSLYEPTYDYSSEDHNFTEWAANDAQLFREAVARAYQEVSEKMVRELLLPCDFPW